MIISCVLLHRRLLSANEPYLRISFPSFHFSSVTSLVSSKMLRLLCVMAFATPCFAVLHSNQNTSADLFHDCWFGQTDFTDLEKLGQNMGMCLKHGMYVNLVTNLEKQCVDVGDGVSFTATTAEQLLTPRDLFPLGEFTI